MAKKTQMTKYVEHTNDVFKDVEELQKIIGDDNNYLSSRDKLNEIHSIVRTIQLKAERMLKFLEK